MQSFDRVLGVVMDPIETISPKKDSTFAMLLAAQARGWRIAYLRQQDLSVRDGTALGHGSLLSVSDDAERWFEIGEAWEGPLEKLDALLAERGVRPTALQPVWSAAGYALGVATALIGPEAAMACTAAVEEEIDRHYTRQLDELGDTEPELSEVIREFREDERAHRDTALAAGAEEAPLFPLLSGAIRLGCRVAIRLSERI